MMGSHGIENQPSSPANDGVPMPSQTILTQSQSEISVTAQSSIPNRSGAEKGKATEVSDQDVKKTKWKLKVTLSLIVSKQTGEIANIANLTIM